MVEPNTARHTAAVWSEPCPAVLSVARVGVSAAAGPGPNLSSLTCTHGSIGTAKHRSSSSSTQGPDSGTGPCAEQQHAVGAGKWGQTDNVSVVHK